MQMHCIINVLLLLLFELSPKKETRPFLVMKAVLPTQYINLFLFKNVHKYAFVQSSALFEMATFTISRLTILTTNLLLISNASLLNF